LDRGAIHDYLQNGSSSSNQGAKAFSILLKIHSLAVRVRMFLLAELTNGDYFRDMDDLYLGLVCLATVCVAVLLLTIRLSQKTDKRSATVVGFFIAFLMGLYLKFLWCKAAMTAILPVSSIIIVGNWFPLLGAFMAGIIWTHGYGSKKRRGTLGTILFLIAAYSTVDPILGDQPKCFDRWDDTGVCRQTSSFTCTPAAATTLLGLHGVAAEESEMAERCLTTMEGTTWQGLYRGLLQKTEGRDIEVEVYECEYDLIRNHFRGPAIISVGLEKDREYPPIYTEQWGWKPGVRHSVVLVEFIGIDRVLVADPSIGLEEWSIADLKTLWRGRAVTLHRTDKD
jgi:hypothetical protein